MSRDGTLPPGVTLAEVNARYAEATEMRCRRCGEWFVPDEDRNYFGRCCAEEDEHQTDEPS